ncbi:hypothetical protein DFH11DRAFT_843897 [Phellopilus nigrolimitatus]|nr:hypothetical protein DFH11DRAFT_843897 [Phellopilus nigrolimitatus]
MSSKDTAGGNTSQRSNQGIEWIASSSFGDRDDSQTIQRRDQRWRTGVRSRTATEDVVEDVSNLFDSKLSTAPDKSGSVLKIKESSDGGNDRHPIPLIAYPNSAEKVYLEYGHETGKDTPEDNSMRSKGIAKSSGYNTPEVPFIPPPPFHYGIPTPYDYHRFYWKCMELKSELIRLDFALRSVGSSGPGIQATNSMKVRLRQLRDLFGANTSSLFPHDVNVMMFRQASESQAYLVEFSRSFRKFAEALDMTAKALYEFHGVYHDEKLMLQLYSLHMRFTTEASTISTGNDFSHKPPPDELQRHIQILMREWVESAVDSLIEAIGNFHEKGVPIICSAQQYKSSRYLDMTTIATFLSGVTASMLQVSVNDSTNATGIAANTFFFSSLVFSIGSAVNSLLVMAWRRSVVREPDSVLPVWFSAWLSTGPMISLLISGVFFSVALCLFAFSLGQSHLTSAVTIAFSGFHAVGLLLLSSWFILEKWKFRRTAGSVGQDLTDDSLTLSVIDWFIHGLESLKRTKQQQQQGSFNVSHTEMGRGPTVSFRPLDSMGEKAYSDTNRNEWSRKDGVWNALSDERFLMNTTFIDSFAPYPDDRSGLRLPGEHYITTPVAKSAMEPSYPSPLRDSMPILSNTATPIDHSVKSDFGPEFNDERGRRSRSTSQQSPERARRRSLEQKFEEGCFRTYPRREMRTQSLARPGRDSPMLQKRCDLLSQDYEQLKQLVTRLESQIEELRQPVRRHRHTSSYNLLHDKRSSPSSPPRGRSTQRVQWDRTYSNGGVSSPRRPSSPRLYGEYRQRSPPQRSSGLYPRDNRGATYAYGANASAVRNNYSGYEYGPMPPQHVNANVLAAASFLPHSYPALMPAGDRQNEGTTWFSANTRFASAPYARPRTGSRNGDKPSLSGLRSRSFAFIPPSPWSPAHVPDDVALPLEPDAEPSSSRIY